MRHLPAPSLAASLCLLLLCLPAAAQDEDPPAAPAPAAPETLEERFGYAYGFQVARQLSRSGIAVDVEQFARAMRDVFEDREPLLSDSQIQEIFAEAQQVAEEAKAMSSRDFLAGNAKKEGVVTTESGLQYLVLEEGQGPSPQATDTVEVHYRGTLVDGTEFDSSHGGEPARFPLNRVIPGWTEGVQLMKKGAKHRLFVPSELGYGASGTQGIPPHSTLIFDIELLGIND